jgi:hypothetical protein
MLVVVQMRKGGVVLVLGLCGWGDELLNVMLISVANAQFD